MGSEAGFVLVLLVFESSANSGSDRELGGPRSGCKECVEAIQPMSELPSRDCIKLVLALMAVASEERFQTGDLES